MDLEDDNDLLAGALTLAADGYKVFPVAGVRMDDRGKWICTCPKGGNCAEPGKKDGSGKHPLFKGRNWQEYATTDPQKIRGWWKTYPEANVARVTGDGIIVIDLDLPKSSGERSGLDEWEAIQEMLGAAPETLWVRTGSGGLHLFYRETSGRRSGQTKNPALVGTKRIDQKANGGYVIAPPSRHKSGGLYVVENDCEIAMAPYWLYDSPGPFAQTRSRSRSRSAVTRVVSTPLPAGDLDPVVTQRMVELRADIDPDAILTETTMSKVRQAVSVGQRSQHVQSICLGASARRFDPVELFQLLLDPENRGGERLQEEWQKDPMRAIDWFATTWQSALEYRASHLSMIDELRQEADGYPWANVTFIDLMSREVTVRKKNLKRVMDASLDLAADYTTTRPMLSQEEIHDRTAVDGKPGLDPKTVRKALHGLEVLGWLELAETRGVFESSVYQFIPDPGVREERLVDPTVLSGEYHLWIARNRQALLDLGIERGDAPLINFDDVAVPDLLRGSDDEPPADGS